jgi:hypothetical protein
MKLTAKQKRATMLYAAITGANTAAHGDSPADYHPADETNFRVTTDGRVRHTTTNKSRVTTDSEQ